MEKASISLWTSRSLYGKNWGISPKITYWLYTITTRPIINYASSVWWKKTQQKKAQEKLSRIQRLACLGITGAMRTTPTAAMEVLLNLPPLHLFIRREARMAVFRNLTEGLGTATGTSNRSGD